MLQGGVGGGDSDCSCNGGSFGYKDFFLSMFMIYSFISCVSTGGGGNSGFGGSYLAHHAAYT